MEVGVNIQVAKDTVERMTERIMMRVLTEFDESGYEELDGQGLLRSALDADQTGTVSNLAQFSIRNELQRLEAKQIVSTAQVHIAW